jgi:hypothetical protein
MSNDEVLVNAVVVAELTEALDACRLIPGRLAQRIGLSEDVVRRMLSGEDDIPMDTLMRSSSALGLLAADLVAHAEDAVREGHQG